MTLPRGVRVIVVAAAVSILAISLGGCSTLAGQAATEYAHAQSVNPGTDLKASGEPVAGDCWKSTYRVAKDYADWGSSRPVDCGSPHQLYTFAVARIPGSFTGSDFDSSGHLKTSVYNGMTAACGAAEIDSELVSRSNSLDMIDFVSFVPSSAKWSKGARWVRCDVGVIAFGSKPRDPALENLPSFASVRSRIHSDPTSLAFCANDPEGPNAGPYSADAVYANCDKNPEWVLVDHIDVQPDANDDYPGLAALTVIYRDRCVALWANATHVTAAHYPTKADWASGPTGIECWIGKK